MKLWLVPVVAVLVLFAAPVILFAEDGPAPAPAPAKALATLKGWIEVAESDDEGKAKSLYLWDEESDDFILLAEDGKGKELFDHLGRRVQLQGELLAPEADGRKRMKVSAYSLLDEFDSTPAPAEEEAPQTNEGDGDAGETPPADDGNADEGGSSSDESFDDE